MTSRLYGLAPKDLLWGAKSTTRRCTGFCRPNVTTTVSCRASTRVHWTHMVFGPPLCRVKHGATELWWSHPALGTQEVTASGKPRPLDILSNQVNFCSHFFNQGWGLTWSHKTPFLFTRPSDGWPSSSSTFLRWSGGLCSWKGSILSCCSQRGNHIVPWGLARTELIWNTLKGNGSKQGTASLLHDASAQVQHVCFLPTWCVCLLLQEKQWSFTMFTICPQLSY